MTILLESQSPVTVFWGTDALQVAVIRIIGQSVEQSHWILARTGHRAHANLGPRECCRKAVESNLKSILGILRMKTIRGLSLKKEGVALLRVPVQLFRRSTSMCSMWRITHQLN